MNAGVAAYAEDVCARRYPGPEHTYSIDPAELAELQRAWPERTRTGPCAAGLAVALGERELLDRPARTGARPGIVAVAHPHVRGERDLVGDREQALDLRLGRHEEHRQRPAEALGA